MLFIQQYRPWLFDQKDLVALILDAVFLESSAPTDWAQLSTPSGLIVSINGINLAYDVDGKVVGGSIFDLRIYDGQMILNVGGFLLDVADARAASPGTYVLSEHPTYIYRAQLFVGDDVSSGVQFSGDIGADSIEGSFGSDTLAGAGGDDTIVGLGGADEIYGGAGNDSLHGSSGGGFCDGGDGNDLIFGGAGSDILVGGAGNDTLDGIGAQSDLASSRDEIYGGSGNDSIKLWHNGGFADGGEGDDFLWGSSGDDWLVGGSGKDTIYAGEGNDIADYSDKTTSVEVRMNAGLTTVAVAGVVEDTIYLVEGIVGGAAADKLFGDYLANTFMGGAGKDLIDGGDYFDLVSYADKSKAVVVKLNGSRDATVKVGNVAEDKIKNIEDVVGGSAGDSLTGDAGSNWLVGLGGNDKLLGGSGFDILEGGAGKDTLTGGADGDTFVFSGSPTATNADTVKDFKSGQDVIVLDSTIYGALGPDIDTSDLTLGKVATGSGPTLVYDRLTGKLYFDPDGAGAAAQALVATFSNKVALQYADFFIV